MTPAHIRWLTVLLPALAGCTAAADEPIDRVQPAFVRHSTEVDYDAHYGEDDDAFRGGPGFWPGYYYPTHDYWARRHFRRHPKAEGGFLFSPHRDVTCDPRVPACFDAEGLDREWTDTVFGGR